MIVRSEFMEKTLDNVKENMKEKYSNSSNPISALWISSAMAALICSVITFLSGFIETRMPMSVRIICALVTFLVVFLIVVGCNYFTYYYKSNPISALWISSAMAALIFSVIMFLSGLSLIFMGGTMTMYEKICYPFIAALIAFLILFLTVLGCNYFTYK